MYMICEYINNTIYICYSNFKIVVSNMYFSCSITCNIKN